MADTKISALDATNAEAMRKKAFTNRGCLAGLSADLTTVNASSGYQVPLNAESYDTDNIHDNTTNNTRLTVPSGWSLARVSFSLHASLVSSGSSFVARVRHMNSAGVEQSRRCLPCQGASTGASLTEFFASGSSASIQVAPGDYFELRVICTDTSITIVASYTALALELLA